jgi:hypothetical protein
MRWLVVVLVACGAPSTPPVTNATATPPVDAAAIDPIVEIQTLLTEMCACHDRACAERVNDDYVRRLQAMAHVKPTAAQLAQGRDLSEEYSRCMMRAITP